MSGFGSVTNGSEIVLTTVNASTITSTALTGSLTKLADGSPYLIAGTNITLTTSSSGSVTIAAAGGGGGGTPGGSDQQIQFNSGSAFSGSSNLTFNYSTSVLSGTVAQFTTVTGSTVTGSNALFTTVTGSFSGSGTNIISLTASNITNFTADVRGQISAGTNISITNGAIAALPSGMILPIRTITASTSIQSTDCVVLLGANTGSTTAFLPSAVSVGSGKVYFISNVTTASTFKVSSSIAGNLNGGTGSVTLASRASDGSAYAFVSDGTDWWFLTH